jgi:hypothetical protein
MKMLQIRSDQRKILSRYYEARLISRLLAFLRKQPQFAVFTDAELRVSTQNAVLEARAYGMRSERSVARFALCALVFGPEFHRYERVQRFFAAEHLTPDERMSLVVELLSREEWEEAAHCSEDSLQRRISGKGCAPGAWPLDPRR